jgi:8-oxo-dGTP pyrophosphatase MutT (NUDIX family)
MSREPVLALLREYAQNDLSPLEREHVEETIRFVETHPDCFLRSCLEGHLTGSAWVVNRERTMTLLTHHRKLGKWLQLGGHADGEYDLLGVAQREAEEESGLRKVAPPTLKLFDVDRHRIPARKEVAEHWHFDLRFLFEADPKEALTVSHESKELAWVGLDQVTSLNAEESMARLVRKTPPLGPELA